MCLGSRQRQQRAQFFFDSENSEEPLAKFWTQVLERLNPPMHAYRHRGREGRRLVSQHRLQRAKIISKILKIGGNP